MKRVRVLMPVASLLCALLWTAACTSTGPYAPYARPGDAPMQQTQRIVILDRNVQGALLFVDSVQKRLPRGEILVQANFQSRYPNDDVWADVKFEFLDGNNVVIDETEWVKTFFPALEVTTVQGSSLTAGAATHVMLLKNLYTASGKRPISPGGVYEIRSGGSALPR